MAVTAQEEDRQEWRSSWRSR